jgi:hypothetical protein
LWFGLRHADLGTFPKLSARRSQWPAGRISVTGKSQDDPANSGIAQVIRAGRPGEVQMCP